MLVHAEADCFWLILPPFSGCLQKFRNTDIVSLASARGCCDMGQNDTIGKIELNPSFVLSSDETNYKNDIQLFHQLFDELRVNRDCH